MVFVVVGSGAFLSLLPHVSLVCLELWRIEQGFSLVFL
jgi:hypothetical protein